MTKLVRNISLALVLMLVFSMFSVAFAGSNSYKGIGSEEFTITTKNKDSKLTVTNKAGTAYCTKYSILKRKYVDATASWYGKFYITVSDGRKTVDATISCVPGKSKANFTLKKNTTYTVKVQYKDFASMVRTDRCKNPTEWKKDPKVELSVNNWLKIK